MTILIKQTNQEFSDDSPTVMHIDMNSCFASCEQQANPLLRGKPLAVAAYTTDSGCILSPSTEAKKLGIKVGMRVKDGKKICPSIVILPSDPEKYRFINKKLVELLSSYTNHLKIKSIDEMVLNFQDMPSLEERSISEIALEIKNRIKKEIGEFLQVSVGISTNQFLAKTASNLHKPNGLDLITKENIVKVFQGLVLEDLCGIKTGNAAKLRKAGILSVLDFYYAKESQLISAFKSIAGHYWYLRLHGFEIDDVSSPQKSFGQSYALPQFTGNKNELEKILCKLIAKMGIRVREAKYSARGIYVGCLFSDNTFWHQRKTLSYPLFSDLDFYQEAGKLLFSTPLKPVKNLAVSCFRLEKTHTQLSLLIDLKKEENRTIALDKINHKWGDFSVVPATMLHMKDKIIDRISFGLVK